MAAIRAHRLAHAITAAMAALVIAAPALLERASPPFTPAEALPETQTMVPPAAPGPPVGLRPGATESLPALLDASARSLMESQHAPGTAVAIVHAGRVIALRAYGLARVETNSPVDAARTAFRVGSVTKPLTAAAVLGLVDEGRLDLFRDIREYLPGLALPFAVNAHQLLTHTAGFDERFAGTFTRVPGDLDPLSTFMRRSLRAAIPPGRFYSYASPNSAVAGWLLEHLSGLSYEEAMAARLFAPLGMTATTTRQPPDDRLMAGVATGYAWDGARHRALPFRYTNLRPAGALSTTAADMSRFMLAVLGDGSLDGVRVLSPESRTRLVRPQFRDHPRLPGVTYGFHEWRSHGRVLLHHDGTLEDHIGAMVLDPDNAFGFFAASNSLPGIANHLIEPVLTHLYGPAPAPPAPVPVGPSGHAAQVAGVYLDLHRTRHDLSRVRALMPMLQARVGRDGDGVLWAGRRWVETAPFVFETLGAAGPLVFRAAGGAVTAMQAGNATYERIAWTAQTPVHLAFLAACLLTFLGYAVLTALRWRRGPEGRAARACALFVTVANLAFVVWLVASLRTLGHTVPPPAFDVAFLTLGVAAAAVATALPGFAAAAWRAAWLNYWKLLGFYY